ncbi:hypothetical protein BGZ63DRAFT_382569 [Mariannaea sp. PMI_226]|nr:hypothetical protein BGZ63DRAFT_382569 [Mariannaea sp. PMI_226]
MAILTVILTVTSGLTVAATPGAIKATVTLLLIYCFLYNVTMVSPPTHFLLRMLTPDSAPRLLLYPLLFRILYS